MHRESVTIMRSLCRINVVERRVPAFTLTPFPFPLAFASSPLLSLRLSRGYIFPSPIGASFTPFIPSSLLQISPTPNPNPRNSYSEEQSKTESRVMMKMTKKKVTILLKEMVDALASMAKAKSLSLSLQTRISALKLRLMLFSLLRDRRFQVGTIPNNLHSLLNRRRRNHHHHHHNNKLEQQKHEQQMIPILNDETQFHRDAEDDKRVVLFYCDDVDSGKSEASVVVNYCDGKSDSGASNLGLAEANRVDTEPEEDVNPVSKEWLKEAAVATAAELGEEEEEVLEGDAEKVLDELEYVVEDGGDDDNVADKVVDELELGNNPAASGPAVYQVVNEIEAESDGGSGGDWLQKSTVEEEEEFDLEDKIDEVADLFIKRFHEQMRMERSPIHH